MNVFYTVKKMIHHSTGILRGSLRVSWLCRNKVFPVLFLGRAPYFDIQGKLSVGPDTRFRSVVKRSLISTGPRGLVQIGSRTSINQGANIFAARSIVIGSRVAIGDDVTIYDTNFHPTFPGEETKVEPVIIEDDVWIGNGSLILPGVTVGRGAVIGARSVVTKSVPRGGLVAGNPARVIRKQVIPDDYQRR